MLLLMLERGMPIDMVLTADTGMEFPEMYAHLAKLDEHLYHERGIHLTTLRHPKGPVSKSDGVPVSSRRILSTKRSTGSRVRIRRSTTSASQQTSRSASKMSNIRWWIVVLQKRKH